MIGAFAVYPIPDAELSFAEVAFEWVREMPQHPDEWEARSHLLRAIWAGTLTARKPTSGDPMLSRELLRIVAMAQVTSRLRHLSDWRDAVFVLRRTA